MRERVRILLQERREEAIVVGVIAALALAAVAFLALTSSPAPHVTAPPPHNPLQQLPPPPIEARVVPGGGSNCSNSSVGLTPINDLGTGDYKGVQGGLYPGGSNTPPPSHLKAGEKLASKIQPLDRAGNPDPAGVYGLVSIGMSITRREFDQFAQIVHNDPTKAPRLAVVNGAQDGITGISWGDPKDPAWKSLDAILKNAGVSPEQVAVAWVEMADVFPADHWPVQAHQLQDELASIARSLHDRFPNLRLAYLSSVRYNGYVVQPVSPEPVMYESAFGVKWVIQDQINGSGSLNYNSADGAVHSPWLGWGPYMWADGTTPRSDGLTWKCTDLYSDGLHPSTEGAKKSAHLLLDFFEHDPTAKIWFTKAG